jgi:hypothetical protein
MTKSCGRCYRNRHKAGEGWPSLRHGFYRPGRDPTRFNTLPGVWSRHENHNALPDRKLGIFRCVHAGREYVIASFCIALAKTE